MPPGTPVLEFVHKTTVEDAPYAICPFQGRVLIGVGKLLRLYDLGKKKLLRKSENKVQLFLKKCNTCVLQSIFNF